MNTHICQSCSTLFTPIIGSYGKFCSLSCSSSFNNRITKENRIKKYLLDPKGCFCCSSSLPYNKRHNKFCSSSCSSKVTNQVARKRGPVTVEKFLFSKVKFIMCSHTNQYYLNKNPDGTTRRCSPYVKTIKEQYYFNARFKFNVYHFPDKFDLDLIKTHGWYSCPGKKRKHDQKNINGVSRDHLISVSYGFKNSIDPKILSHPANCRIMIHLENKRKHAKCELTLNELLAKIANW